MKIPAHFQHTIHNSYDHKYIDALCDTCLKRATKISAKTGIAIKPIIRQIKIGDAWSNEIIFEAMGQEFESLRDVKKAIKMKAFI